MKNRILSLVLATLMIVSMTALFAVSSTAEDAYVTVVVGTAYGVPGETAMVDVYIQADVLPDDYDHLRNWQFAFDGAQGTGERDCYVSGGDKFGFFNEGENQYGFTSDTGENCGVADWFLARGGFKVAALGFTVPADAVAGEEIEVSIKSVDAVSFETATVEERKVDAATVETVAGLIKVVASTTAAAEEYEGDGEDYAIPAVDEDGNPISSMLNEDGDPIITGSFGTLTIPAAVTDIEDGLGELETEAIVLKNTNLDDGAAKAIAKLGTNSSPVTVYIHKRPNGMNGTADAFDSLSAANKKKVAVKNILLSDVTPIVEGDKVSFVAGIAVDDLDYTNLTVSADFGVKQLEATMTGVYRTLTGLASVNEEAAEANSVIHADGYTYITGMTVVGVPSGSYDVTVTLFGTTADEAGNTIVVCSDPVTVTVTV